MSKQLIRILIFIAVGIAVIAIAFYSGRRSANRDAEVDAAKAKIKLLEIQLKSSEDSSRKFKDNWKLVESAIPVMAKEIDSLEKIRGVNVTHTTYLPVVKYKKNQLDSIWRDALK